MKTKLLLPLALLLALLSACSTPDGGHIDVAAIIEASGLKRDFQGDVVLHEAVKAPGGPSLEIKVFGLYYNGERWVWSGLEETRNGIWTSGGISVTPRAITAEQK